MLYLQSLGPGTGDTEKPICRLIQLPVPQHHGMTQTQAGMEEGVGSHGVPSDLPRG